VLLRGRGAVLRGWLTAALLFFACRGAAAQSVIELAAARPSDPITISADQANRWKEGSYVILLLRGRCVVSQGGNVCRGNDAVVWIKEGDGTEQRPSKVVAYLEGDVQIEAGRRPDVRQPTRPPSNDRGWLGRFSAYKVNISTPPPRGEPTVKPAFYQNALDMRDPPSAITRTQYVPSNRGAAPPVAHIPPPPGTQTTTPAATNATTSGGLRHLRIFPRGETEPHIIWDRSEVSEEGVAVITGGVQIFIDLPQGQLDIASDKVVLWTVGEVSAEVRDKYQEETVPLEVYLEGNVVFRQGDRVIYADRMYYDVKNKTATVLQAEVTTPAPKFGGMMRLKSDLLRQVNDDTFYAQHSYFTSSQLGAPRYRVQSENVRVYDRQRPLVNPFTGTPTLDPGTREPVIEHDQMLTASNNTMFIGPVPVFWWPRFTTTLEQPSTVLQSVHFQEDNIFGFWSEADLNAFQLLGLKKPQGTNWTLVASDLTKRGAGGGTDVYLNRPNLFGIQSPATATLMAWGLGDHGFDNLGRTRQGIIPPSIRGRVFGQYHQTIPDGPGFTDGVQMFAELGLISDYNFLEQYYEAEYETHKDETTDLQFRKAIENREWTLYGQVRVNPIFDQTNWLPRLDHYTMGQSLAGDRITWFEHSNGAYAQFLRIHPPTDPQDQANFNFLPWETTGNHQGDRVATRQEIDAPLELGPVKLVPYGLGEVAQWGQDLAGKDVARAFGQVGMRGSVLFWAANPNIESNLFNVHGVAHKVVFDVDAFAAGSSLNMTELALYDPIDDNATDRYRRRFMSLDYAAVPGEFGGTLPAKFDPRFYDLRSGIQSFVASPTTEIAGNLNVVQLGMRHRWQTKRGPLGNRRVIDWIVLNTQASYFPNAARDDFGAAWGLVGYDFRWHVGDRLTVLSDFSRDFFYQGMKTFSVGATLSRAPNINLYAGIRTFSGPFTYNTATFSQSYQLSPKWLATASTSFTLTGQGNIGETFSFSRVGEAFIVNVSAYVDAGKGNQGVNVMVTPRFLGQNMLRNMGGGGGGNVPMAGMYGLQ
jgi:lipopolysaccharide export system protein LptA